ncbi:AzlC family ABC transporter permease [Sharpea azabuensis]|uniref:AzlC family ABC transporter permease n=1 Tax=Sharpea azabuensis TaxID=322505 RepID=UPI000EC173B7|nr:AzlC family ABC transporter permease [Sharpea azabuensis]HAJ15623.1 branched-chain amino acid transporter AzlC [Erysipelotrichaceae bacterium]
MDIKKRAFKLAMPVMLSYLFMSLAYGLMMQQAHLAWYYSILASLLIYTGAFQYVLVGLITISAPLMTILITALFMNARLFFYGPTFAKLFKTSKHYLYLIHSFTDETYGLDLKISDSKQEKQVDMMYYVALFSQTSWLVGTLLGATIGTILPLQLKGVEFCMTAMFITIVIDQWESHDKHFPTIMSAVVAIVLLGLLGGGQFMLPSLLVSTLLLVIYDWRMKDE